MLRGGSRNDPERNRYGCFLPDLTGLATTPSARLPRRIWAKRVRRARSEQMQSFVHLVMQHTRHADAVRALVKIDEVTNAPSLAQTPASQNQESGCGADPLRRPLQLR